MTAVRACRHPWLRLCFAAAAMAGFLAVGSTPALAHDVFRLVGTITKWDSAKSVLTIKTRETQADGSVLEETVRMSVQLDTVVMRQFKKVPLSELKPGVFVVIDAAGVDKEIDATEIEIIVPNKPAKPAASVRKSPATHP